jgi:hypothetical protein
MMFSMSFGSLSLSETCTSLIFWYVILRSSFSLFLCPAVLLIPAVCYSLFYPNQCCQFLVPLLVFFIIHIHFATIRSFCVILCIIPSSTTNIVLYLIDSSDS